MTDNVTSAPWVGQSPITQKEESRAEQAQDQEDLLSGKNLFVAVCWSQNIGELMSLTINSLPQKQLKQQKPDKSFHFYKTL